MFLLATLVVGAFAAAQSTPPPRDSMAPPEGRPGRDRGIGPPPDSRFFHGLSLMALDEKASLLAEQGRNDAAIAELRKVYAYDLPKDSPVFEVRVRLVGKLARLLAAAGHTEEAVKTVGDLLTDVAKGTPSEAAAWFEAGKTYRTLGMVEDALRAYDQAIAASDELATHERRVRLPAGGGLRERHPDGVHSSPPSRNQGP
jgi:tetratricopeptide (TPR) repeat protein